MGRMHSGVNVQKHFLTFITHRERESEEANVTKEEACAFLISRKKNKTKTKKDFF